MHNVPIVDLDDAAREVADALRAAPPPEMFDPWAVIAVVHRALADHGLHPLLRGVELRSTEAAARELLLCLGIEPTRVGNEVDPAVRVECSGSGLTPANARRLALAILDAAMVAEGFGGGRR